MSLKIEEMPAAPEFVTDSDGKESYAKISAGVADEMVADVLRWAEEKRLVTIYMRAQTGVLSKRLREWADQVDAAEAPSRALQERAKKRRSP